MQKFGPEIAKRARKHLKQGSLDWHADETYIWIRGRWRYLWRAIDANGYPVDFRLTARRDARAAKAFLKSVIERVRLHGPVSICMDQAPTYRKVIREINHAYDPHSDFIKHIDRKYLNNRTESVRAALKRLLGQRQIFRPFRSAKAKLAGMETIRTTKRGHIQDENPAFEERSKSYGSYFKWLAEKRNRLRDLDCRH